MGKKGLEDFRNVSEGQLGPQKLKFNKYPSLFGKDRVIALYGSQTDKHTYGQAFLVPELLTFGCI